MTQNDFLKPLFSLGPLRMAFLVWFWGFGSLLLVAIKTHSAGKLFTHPGFIVGDFLMLPLAGFLITCFYQRVNTAVSVITSSVWSYAAVILALALALSSAVRNDMLNVWWLGHLTFYWFMAYVASCFVAKGLLQLILGRTETRLWLIWIGVIAAISIHLLLPVIFGSKGLPNP